MTINVAIGLVALAVDWRWRRIPAPLPRARSAEEVSPKAAGAVVAPPLASEPAVRLGAQLGYRGASVTGMCALALEVTWTRAIPISVRTTTCSFTVMLASFLVGIWLGSWLHAVLPLRRIRPHVELGVVMSIIGLSGFTLSSVTAHSMLQEITLVEIEPAVVDA